MSRIGRLALAFGAFNLLAAAGVGWAADAGQPLPGDGKRAIIQDGPHGAGYGEVVEPRLIELRFDPRPSNFRVPPPREALLLEKGLIEAKSSITINYFAAGTTSGSRTCIAWPDAARAAFTYAANIWGSLLQSNVPITVDACWSNNMSSGTLGSAGPVNLYRDVPGSGTPVAGTFYPVALVNAIRGSDIDTTKSDIVASFNSTFTWYFGTDGNTPAGQTDFASVALHEIGHGLGFLGTMDVAGGLGTWGLGSPPFPAIYDRFTENGAGQVLLNNPLFPNSSAALAAQLQSGSVFFNGANANAGNGGGRVPLYAPATWNDGSSYSHLAESFNSTANDLMTFALPSGSSIHSPGPVTLGIFKDSGWTVISGGTTFTLSVSKSGTGTVTSSPAGINCGATCSASFNAGTVVTLSASPGSGFSFTGWSGGGCTGTGTCTVTVNAATTVTATFSSVTGTGTRLINISTRGPVLTGNDVMIGGFIISGTSPKKVLITARGPSLTAFGVSGAISDPVLNLFSGQTVIATNDDFGFAPNLAEIQATGVAPTNSLESAILVTLNPGAYTAIVTGYQGATGVGIVEVFEVGGPDIQLINISTRGHVQTGNNVMIGGFIISGSTPRTVLITARGPSLVPFGITNALANPNLQLFSGQTQIASNDNWQTNGNASAILSTGVAPTSSLESALLITLNPGAYTAIVTGVGGTSGVGIVEVFAQ